MDSPLTVSMPWLLPWRTLNVHHIKVNAPHQSVTQPRLPFMAGFYFNCRVLFCLSKNVAPEENGLDWNGFLVALCDFTILEWWEQTAAVGGALKWPLHRSLGVLVTEGCWLHDAGSLLLTCPWRWWSRTSGLVLEATQTQSCLYQEEHNEPVLRHHSSPLHKSNTENKRKVIKRVYSRFDLCFFDLQNHTHIASSHLLVACPPTTREVAPSLWAAF